MVASTNDSDGRSAFQVLTKAIGGRTRRGELIDANVGELQTRESTAKRRGYRVRIGEATTRLCISIEGFETTLCFFVGRKSSIDFYVSQTSTRLPAPYQSIQVFTRVDFGTEGVCAWLKDDDNLRLLHRLGCSRTQPLYVVRNGLHLIVDKNRAHVDHIDLLIELAERLPRPKPKVVPGVTVIDGLEFDPLKLPVPLRALAPYVSKWAVGDDGEREVRIADATSQEVDKLLAHAAPLLESMNEYLDSFKENALPDEAVLIGNLAEVVAELISQ